MTYIVYHHKNAAFADYLVQGSTLLAKAHAVGDVRVESLPQQSSSKSFAGIPPALRRLLFFARPDAVICLDDGKRPEYPIFALELTNHVPAQDHWMQRFNHLVGCAIEGVPGAYILPFEMRNHPTFPSELDHVFFYAYERVTEIHQCPTFIAEWEVVGGNVTKCDPVPQFSSLPDRSTSDIKLMFEFLDKVVDYASHGRQISALVNERLMINLRDRVRRRAYAEIPEIQDFSRLSVNHPNNRALTHTKFTAWLNKKGVKLPVDFPARLKQRDKYLIWTPQVGIGGKSKSVLRNALNKRIQKKGGDPYLGQPLAFDYLFCRLGRTPYERDVSLVLDLSVLKFSDLANFHRKIWQGSPLQHTTLKRVGDIPTYNMYLKENDLQLMKNVLRIYAYAADVIVYEDGLVYS